MICSFHYTGTLNKMKCWESQTGQNVVFTHSIKPRNEFLAETVAIGKVAGIFVRMTRVSRVVVFNDNTSAGR